MSTGQDGGDAAAQHVVDRGPVPEEGRRHPVRVQEDPHVHLRLRILSQEKQSERNLRGQTLIRVLNDRHYIDVS